MENVQSAARGVRELESADSVDSRFGIGRHVMKFPRPYGEERASTTGGEDEQALR